MRKLAFCICVLGAVVSLLLSPMARAGIFGSVRGIIHDAQHRPVPAATVTLTSATSAWTQSTQTDQDGAFAFADTLKVRLDVFNTRRHLVPLLNGLDVDSSNDINSIIDKALNQMSANEAAGSANDYLFIGKSQCTSSLEILDFNPI